MISAAEAEMAALYITARKMVSLRNTLIEMGWQQANTLIQTDNSTAVVFTNKTMVNKGPNQRTLNCGGSEIDNPRNNSDTIGHQDMKMKEITAQRIILLYIMKKIEQTHYWCDFPLSSYLST